MSAADSATTRVRPIDLTPETVCSPSVLAGGSGADGSTWALLTPLTPGVGGTEPAYSGAGLGREDVGRTVRSAIGAPNDGRVGLAPGQPVIGGA